VEWFHFALQGNAPPGKNTKKVPLIPGSGGDGGFIMAAPKGIEFTGKLNLGPFGAGVIYGRFRNTGTCSAAVPDCLPYTRWTSMRPADFFLYAGTGGGGGGGDGHLESD
jgi:hypothetical protein